MGFEQVEESDRSNPFQVFVKCPPTPFQNGFVITTYPPFTFILWYTEKGKNILFLRKEKKCAL